MTRERKSFLRYEAYYFGYVEIESKGNLTKEEKAYCRKARAWCRRWELRRKKKLAQQSRLSGLKAYYALKRFYKTHNPPYTNEDKLFIIANVIGYKKGRISLVHGVLEPIKCSV